MNKIAIFFRKYGHKILTFCIGLAFLGFCAFMIGVGVHRVYHMFRPEHIYEEGVDPDLIWKGAAFDELRSSGLEQGSAEYFEQYIANFVRQDFPTFTNPLELNTDYFVSYGIWQAIKVNGQGVYAYQDDGSFLIPKADVEKYARLNFDYLGEIPFHDVEVNGKFNYESFSGCFRVEPNATDLYLVPNVIDVKYDEQNGVYTLLVDCYINDGLSEEDITTDPTKFGKRISITMQEFEEMHEIDGVEVPVTNYLYTSCALVDETIENNAPGTVEPEGNLDQDPNLVD